MSYVLIIFVWISGYARGSTATTADFQTQLSCEQAKLEIMRQFTQWSYVKDILAVCVKK